MIDTELQSGERILWMGQPIPSRFAGRSIVFVLFGIPWTAFALFWMAGASRFQMPEFNRGSDFFSLFGIPFVIVGLGLLCSPYWLMRQARKTAYVVTDRRAIIFVAGLLGSTTVRSFYPDRLKDIRRVQKPDGTGDLIFAGASASNGQFTDHGFLAIADVRDVEEVINRICCPN